MSETKTRVLLGSPIHQKPQVLEQFLNSLLRLRRDGIALDFYFIDDNGDSASSLLLQQYAPPGSEVFLQSSGFHDAYIRNDTTHYWNSDLVWKVAGFKNLMIRRADAFGYDHLFLIDSDLILHPDTLLHLIGTGKDIISEVFWTQWQPGTMLQPQVWMHDEYNQWEILPGEKPSQTEINRRFHAFLAKLQLPGIYEVGGLGACTLISRLAISSGVSYDMIRNISYWGEDRHFCIRAAALGIPLYVDTHYPALHLYRDSDLEKVADYIRQTTTELAAGGGSGAEDGGADGAGRGTAGSGAGAAHSVDTLGGGKADGGVGTADGSGNKAVDGVGTADGGGGNGAAAEPPQERGGTSADGLWSAAEAEEQLRKAPPADGSDGTAEPAAAGDAPPAARRPRLTLTMIVKNESQRFLRQVLQQHRTYIDEAVIIDDGSTDNTADICREVLHGIPLHLVRNDVSKFNNEADMRLQQWEEVVKTNPEWILSLDADEVFEDRFASDIKLLLQEESCDLFCFRLYDFWDDNHYREDNYWRSHQSYRPFLLRYREEFAYVWNNTPQHCGRLPENIFELPHQLSNLRLKHLGWSKPEYRLDKYLRYMLLDPDGQYGWKEQYQSILDQQPKLVPWVE
ncbi:MULTISPECIES: glycosyltransferase [unclassified Paenibacillus]|uniref:glycosyltransferase family 2 protein n=1 Tax=unclassified Paenibacillus TaxID=185978 RepID=UPI0024072F9A|nr:MULTISPECIES: glycosyltransferase [unclassified Paenibacillus]MDF9840850.1 glycosyltransferase involved in cell wall biosynthesis [Paenibacillus sp. PastF-2]MDF9847434.1 glycosyltransferase involved in cell wall biosynthesis [Paenibacillus sp. PastM-2]MDF9853989.1 glycosyltransferase involved in cell wall biosynthesis [Paenibacillus sp. PastF-1]MDH6479261.1 glycosyltransferase involved in cell wall biosynthesis [Paenibacillus sp. PastH-2]MDH6507003.1 glycosyltransferase involved in cell wal